MLKGINSNMNTKFTLESLGIKEGSKEVLIFNEIDLSDGKEDGFLTKQQYQEYMERTFSKTKSFLKGLFSIPKAMWDRVFGNTIKQKNNAQISEEALKAYEEHGKNNSVAQSSAEGLKKLKENN